MLRIGLLQCDSLDAPHAAIDGDYDVLVADLVGGDGVAVEAYRVDLGEFPTSVTSCDGWVVSGSRHGVEDDLEWITSLTSFVGRAVERDRPVAGICFGHQVVAAALGAPVGRADVGWNIGAIDYQLTATAPGEQGGAGTEFALIASHRDQVLGLPDGADLLATSERCPIAGFTLDEHVVTVQGHPEFTPALATSLYRARSRSLEPAEVDRAIATLTTPLANERVGAWMLDVFGR